MKLIAGLILLVGAVAIAEANPRRHHRDRLEEMPEIITIDLDSNPLDGLMSLLAPNPKGPSEDTELLRQILGVLERIYNQFPTILPEPVATQPEDSEVTEPSVQAEPSDVTDLVPARTDGQPQDLPPTANAI